MCQATAIPIIDRNVIRDHLDLLEQLILDQCLDLDAYTPIGAAFANIRLALYPCPVFVRPPDDPNQNRLPFGITTIGG